MAKWRNWTAREKCVVSAKEISERRPAGLEYQGVSEYGTHYYRRADETFWIHTRRAGDGKFVWVKISRER